MSTQYRTEVVLQNSMEKMDCSKRHWDKWLSLGEKIKLDPYLTLHIYLEKQVPNGLINHPHVKPK